METPQPGTTVGGKYRLLCVLGQGAMGTVFEAEHNVSGKHVALKWMHLEASRDPEAAQRFIREARASAKLQHPNVVDVYDVESTDDEAYLVMERLKGQPFSALLGSASEPLYSMLRHLSAAMRGVEAAHDQGVVHRDIKPDNIFLAQIAGQSRPVAKVLDFGISKVVGAESLAMTRAGAAMGTPQYMSLEQLYGQRDVDLRADIYAFGVMLFEAATGQLPYDSETITELAVKVATTEPPDPKTLRPDLPSGLCAVIARAMARDRDQRHSNLAELIADLEPYTTHAAMHVQTQSAGSVRPISLQPWPNSPGLGRWRQTALASIGATALIAIALALFARNDRPAASKSTSPHGPTSVPSSARSPSHGATTLKANLGPTPTLPEGMLPPQRGRKTRQPKPLKTGQSSTPVKKRAAPSPATPRRVLAPTTELPRAKAQPPAPQAQPPAPQPAHGPAQTKPRHQAKIATPARPQLPVQASQPKGTPSTQAAPFIPASARQPVARAARRIPAVTPQRGLTYRSVVQLKAAYRNGRLGRADYKQHTRALKLWRKQALVESKQLYRQRLISKAEYKTRARQINQKYKGR